MEVHNGGAQCRQALPKGVESVSKRSPIQRKILIYRLREEVLGLLVKGKSYKMIADELCISYDTVRAHMKKIYEKLHVSSMTEAVAKAINKNIFGFF
ncbi:MAG: helix-turn-helix transcriptional regulator [Bacteroidetes bacterium]|nr:helix-turn-helix transcriptional regulator [Bacteroidota bacterium]